MNPPPAPTDRWLAAAAHVMPPLTGPAGVGERLLLLVHYGVDWQDGWVTRYRNTYWDQLLPDRIIGAHRRPCGAGGGAAGPARRRRGSPTADGPRR